MAGTNLLLCEPERVSGDLRSCLDRTLGSRFIAPIVNHNVLYDARKNGGISTNSDSVLLFFAFPSCNSTRTRPHWDGIVK